MNKNKLLTMQEAVSQYVEDGMTVAIEGFTAFICFAAAHEIIRQRKQKQPFADHAQEKAPGIRRAGMG